MSVDMYEHRFRKELRKVEAFRQDGTWNREVWPTPDSQSGEFPAWRALFTSLCLYGHSTGYRLFSYEDFFKVCKNAYTKSHPNPARFKRYFKEPLLEGMRHRVGVWYESGMAETYLYVCLVQALEDKAKVGVVLYDPRADWKLKSDIVIHMNGRTMRVSAYFGPSQDRPRIEQQRDAIERERKQNTTESAHWGNAALENIPLLEIRVTDEDMQVVNGCRLFSIEAVNQLLNQLYDHAGVGQGRWTFPQQTRQQ
ncbi:hypothetical protein JOF41_006667 [Saccharothrix coeruleofusca]|uniref:hypothetical protein n=1 Tax=Saccharothrix coeruleofusca TaxID=33919 RepID=UPI001AE1B230|nr:hypothetical protein [Saccharothrix coeruleofusca]MBP2340489.1 hypothetical protein [Saccharothrix coeruleofusca]